MAAPRHALTVSTGWIPHVSSMSDGHQVVKLEWINPWPGIQVDRLPVMNFVSQI